MHPRLLLSTLLATALLAVSPVASAAFPDKPIKLIIGFPAGGPLDQHARLLSDKLQAVLGQPVMIDYKSGAGGTVGAQEVMKAPADGYTLMLANTGVMEISSCMSRTALRMRSSRTRTAGELPPVLSASSAAPEITATGVRNS